MESQSCLHEQLELGVHILYLRFLQGSFGVTLETVISVSEIVVQAVETVNLDS